MVSMGVSISRVSRGTASPRLLLGFAIASVAANVVIVVTGGAVRLSGSGLGCPTWPTCQGDSLTPTGPSSYHKVIEFTNRQLTIVLVVIALITAILAWRQHREQWLATLALAVIPVQAVIGGISVRTDLNPWVVALHLLASMASIAVTVVLLGRLRHISGVPRPPTVGLAASRLARLIVVVTVCVLAAGTVVSGAGPHSGAKHSSQRIAIKPSSVTQLHADLVMVLLGLTAGLIAVLYAVHASHTLRRAALVLLATELAQGVIGYAQYFSGLPGVLVGVHMFGSCLVWIAAVYTVLVVRSDAGPRPSTRFGPAPSSEQLPHRVDEHTDQGADDRAVHADELQVTPDLDL
jgi:cytochrome c oxidase assembly protein subunit 15